MPEKEEALGVLLVLLPGFACSYLVQLIGARRKKPEYGKQTELDKIVEALIFSFVLYILSLSVPSFHDTLPVSWRSDPLRPGQYQVLFNYNQLATLAAMAVIMALLYSAAISHGWLKKTIEWMRIAEPTSNTTIMKNALLASNRWVQVGISGGRSLIGWLRNYPDKYSEVAEEAFLFLEQAAWVVKDSNGDQAVVNIEGPGILLPEATEIEYVIFLGDESSR